MVVVVQLLSCARLLRPHGLQPTRLLNPWDSSGKSTRVGCHFLLQGIFLTQGSSLYCRQILYQLSHEARLSISSLFSPRRLYVSRNLSVSSRFHSLLAYNCLSQSLCLFFFFLLRCGILVCHPGIEPRPMAVKTRPPENSSLQSLLIIFYFCDISCNVFY